MRKRALHFWPARAKARIGGCIAVVAFCVGIAESWAAATSKVAFVVGNADYKNVQSLENPVSDARALSEVLKLSGFDVASIYNATQSTFLASFERFLALAETADVVLIYFAGHGVQINSKNFLIPTDASLERISDLPINSIELDRIYRRLEVFKNFKIVLLDACQDNPFDSSNSSPDGLAAVSADLSSFLVSYAAQPGQVAFDGVGAHSPFTSALLSHIPTTGLELLPLLSRVNLAVQKKTGGRQSPYVYYSVKPDFFFFEGQSDYRDTESLFWQVASVSNDQQLIGLYENRFPNGKFLADIKSKKDAPKKEEIRNLRSGSIEREIIQLFLRTKDREIATYYLSNYPNGSYQSYFEEYVSRNEKSKAPDYDHLCRQNATHPNDATPGYPGVSYRYLVSNSNAAIQACRQALSLDPDNSHIMAMLARGLAAAGDIGQSLELYNRSAKLGDHRAIVSLGLLYETGSGVHKDFREAERLYEAGVELGSTDAAVNLAALILTGKASSRDTEKAEALLDWAENLGAPRAAYNLGVLKSQSASDRRGAIDHFVTAGVNGFARGYLAAADLLDKGNSVERNPALAAEYLLRAVAIDNGEAQLLLSSNSRRWSRDVIRQMQLKLKETGLYLAALDGLPGRRFSDALSKWRSP